MIVGFCIFLRDNGFLRFVFRFGFYGVDRSVLVFYLAGGSRVCFWSRMFVSREILM